MATKTKRDDRDGPEAVEARDRERRKREGLDEAQQSRGPDRSPPRRSADAERDDLRERVASAEREVEDIHAARETALRRARERVRKFEHEARRLGGARSRNAETAKAAFGRLVAECRDDAALDAAARSYLPHLRQPTAMPALPSFELVARWLLSRPELGFAEFIEGVIDREFAAGDPDAQAGLDPRSHAELDAEIERVRGELDAAKADLEAAQAAKRESAAVLNQHMRGGTGDVLFTFIANAKETSR